MNQEDTFRAVLILGFLVILPIGLFYRIRSRATGARLDRWQAWLRWAFAVGLTLWTFRT